MDWGVISANLLAPQVLFFALGMAATLLRSDLDFPRAMTRAMSLYLLFSIGMHGGVELAKSGFGLATIKPLLAGVVVSAAVPFGVFALLRRRLGDIDAAAIGATYGSISAVTFVTACSFLEDRGIAWSGNMVAAMALMESPAILVAVLLARRSAATRDDAGRERTGVAALLHEAFVNSSVFLLLGSLAIGLLTGERGWAGVAPFAQAPFKGVLCLFLLDMGIIAARRLGDLRESGWLLLVFAIVAPLILACLAVGLAWACGFSVGNATLFTVLCSSASYIAVPAALRTSLPAANPSLFLPMSLAVTFPFNVTIGIPLYAAVVSSIWGWA